MPITDREGWLRLPKNDRRQHYFRGGMSECGRYVTWTARFSEAERPDAHACRSCLVGAGRTCAAEPRPDPAGTAWSQ